MWIYKQFSGELVHNDTLAGVGYSGHEAGLNNPELEDVPDIGPIPRGYYFIGTPFTHPRKGPVCMRLTPEPGNDAHGRLGFMMHGDSKEHPGEHEASAGCIVIARNVRDLVVASHEVELCVI